MLAGKIQGAVGRGGHWRQIEIFGQKGEITRLDTGHCGEKSAELFGVGIELFENGFTVVADLILGFASFKSGAQVVPETEEAIVEYLRHTTDAGRAFFVEEGGSLGGVLVAALGTVSLTVEELERDQGVEEIAGAARVQAQVTASCAAVAGPLLKTVKVPVPRR